MAEIMTTTYPFTHIRLNRNYGSTAYTVQVMKTQYNAIIEQHIFLTRKEALTKFYELQVKYGTKENHNKQSFPYSKDSFTRD